MTVLELIERLEGVPADYKVEIDPITQSIVAISSKGERFTVWSAASMHNLASQK